MNTPRDQERFFFAQDDADYYDETIELAVPQYSLILRTMVDVIEAHFKSGSGNIAPRFRGVVLDVGAGTGAESIPLLARFPELSLLAVDISKPMEAIFVKNYLAKIGDAESLRYRYLVGDILDIENTDSIPQEVYSRMGSDACVAAISAYCIHHFSAADKERVYKKMFEFLEPGGILINVDLFTYESREVAREAHEFDIRYIEEQFEHPDPCFANKAESVPIETRRELKDKWVYHMNNDNILDSVDLQLQILRNVGFVNVESVFRYWQQGIIRATKPS